MEKARLLRLPVGTRCVSALRYGRHWILTVSLSCTTRRSRRSSTDSSLRVPCVVVGVRPTPGSTTTVAQPNVSSGFSSATFAAFDVGIHQTLPPSLPSQLSGQKDVEIIAFCCDRRGGHFVGEGDVRTLIASAALALCQCSTRTRSCSVVVNITADAVHAFFDVKVAVVRSSTSDAPPPVFTDTLLTDGLPGAIRR